MTARRWLLLALAAAAVLLLAGRALSGAYIDYRWYAAMGATEVWRARVGSGAFLLLASWVVATLFAFVNLFAVRHSVVSLVLPRRVANLDFGEEVPGSYLTGAVVTISVVLGALLTIPQGDWSSFLAARSHIPFGESDPYLDADLGFFVYWLPFEVRLYTWLLVSIVIVSAVVLFLYALTPSLRWERGSLYVSAYVRRHATVLAGVLLAMLAWSYRLDRYALLSRGSGADGAFTALDHSIALPGALILAVVTVGAALVVIWAGWTGQIRMASGAITGVLVLSLVVRQVAPFVARRMGDARRAQLRERPYEATRQGYTRRAFAVDRVLRADSSMAFASLPALSLGASIWDPGAIAAAQERTRPVDVPGTEFGWRRSAAGIVADVPERTLPRGGWSLVHVQANAADENGAVVRLAAAGGGESEAHPIAPPLVGDSATGPVIVSDSTGNIVGTRLDGSLVRLAHAWSEQRPRLLFEELAQPAPTLVDRRGVRERVGALAPYFTQGTVVTPVVLGDSLFWVLDLYAASSTYPLSRRIPVAGDDRSYFQHAATAIVASATGRVRLVADSVLDPLARTWVRRFPSIFGSVNELPPALRDALPPPVDGIYAQAVAYGRYGSRTEDAAPRHLPPPADGADSALIAPDAPFVLPRGTPAIAIPLIGDQDRRVHGVMIGVGGARRAAAWYPLAAAGPRWSTVLERLRAEHGDSGAAPRPPLVRGTVRALPVEGGIAYLQTAYSWRTQGAGVPAIHHVALFHDDSVRVASTLARIAGLTPPRPIAGAPVPTTVEGLRATVDSLYRAMRGALQRNDWRAFGQAFDALGRLGGSARP